MEQKTLLIHEKVTEPKGTLHKSKNVTLDSRPRRDSARGWGGADRHGSCHLAHSGTEGRHRTPGGKDNRQQVKKKSDWREHQSAGREMQSWTFPKSVVLLYDRELPEKKKRVLKRKTQKQRER